MIKIEDCKPGYLYRLNARNIRMGIFTAQANGPRPGFIGIRTKFGSRFLEAELHYDADPHFGTAKPRDYLEACPIENQAMHLEGYFCPKCQEPMEKRGEIGTIHYVHRFTTDCDEKYGYIRQNNELFDWIDGKLKEERAYKLKELEKDTLLIVERFYDFFELRDEGNSLLKAVKIIRDMKDKPEHE